MRPRFLAIALLFKACHIVEHGISIITEGFQLKSEGDPIDKSVLLQTWNASNALIRDLSIIHQKKTGGIVLKIENNLTRTSLNGSDNS